MAYRTIIIATILFAQAFCALEVNKIGIGTPIQTPANLSYDDLLYILKSRHGVVDPKPKLLSPCARAILGCCKDNKMNESCSESLNCGAFFFDVNPCDELFVVDALKSAKAFYKQLDRKKGD